MNFRVERFDTSAKNLVCTGVGINRNHVDPCLLEFLGRSAGREFQPRRAKRFFQAR